MTTTDAIRIPAPRAGRDADEASHDGLPPGRRGRAAATLWLSVVLAVIDAAIANVALPTIATDLRASAADAIWVVNSYQLAIAVSLLPLASLAGIAGYRRVYVGGLALFTAASLACALAPSLALLALARAIQGVGAAGVMSINLAILRHVFPPALLGRGIAWNGLFVALGSALGPALAGGILSVAPWPALFLVNVPLGAAAVLIARRTLPEIPRASQRFDLGSAALNVLAIGGVVGAVDLVSRGAPAAGLPLGAVGLAASAWLARRQRGRPAPLLPVDLLATPAFLAALVTSVIAFAGATAALVSIPFLLERGLGRSPVETGLLMTVWPVAIMLAAPVVARAIDRVPNRALSSAGLLAAAAALVLARGVGPGATDLAIAWRLALLGAAFATFQAPNNREMVRAAPLGRSGGASALLAVGRLLGQTLGALLVGIVFAGGAAGLGPARHVLGLAALIIAVAAAVSLLRTAGLRRA